MPGRPARRVREAARGNPPAETPTGRPESTSHNHLDPGRSAGLGDGMEKVDYDARLHAVYAAGRQMPPDALAHLDGGIRSAPARDTATGLARPGLGYRPHDPLFGECLRRPRLRSRAVRQDACSSPGPRWPSRRQVCGRVCRAHPVADASCDAALLFFVWHHVADREGAAQELRRVVKPGGKLFVQANFSDKMPDIWWFRVVPEWGKVDTAQFRSEKEVKGDFTGAGWTLVTRDEVTCSARRTWPRTSRG